MSLLGAALLVIGLPQLVAPAITHHGHVCSRPHYSLVNVRRVRSYSQPVYNKVMRKCENGSRMCPHFRVVYAIRYREVYGQEARTQPIYFCCPGWTRTYPSLTGCLIPVCQNACLNGGKCVGPNVCECQTGWMGQDCTTDVDECGRPELARCEQVCENIAGSYRCHCHQGFELRNDSQSCQLYLSCSPEYQRLSASHDGLTAKLQIMEGQQMEMVQNLSAIRREYSLLTGLLGEQLDHLTTAFTEIQSNYNMCCELSTRQTSDTVTTQITSNNQDGTGNPVVRQLSQNTLAAPSYYDVDSDYAEYYGDWDSTVERRLQSLSEQIALLEERIEPAV